MLSPPPPSSRPPPVILDGPLSWSDVASVAQGAELRLAPPARRRIEAARAIVDAIVARGIRAYGVNTGVGALSDVVVDRPQQRQLSRNLLMSHACGIGAPLGAAETRAIIAAQVNNYARGHSGVRPAIAEHLLAFLAAGILPVVPSRGSVGYLTHMAHIGLVLIGEGMASAGDEPLSGAAALARLGLQPLVLEAKEGLSLVNGTPCATGFSALALSRAQRLLDWADAAAAMSFENLRGQQSAFAAQSLALRASPGLVEVGRALGVYLDGSPILASAAGARTQDALSLRAVPHVHGAARDVFAEAAAVVGRELAATTDNPAVAGTPEAPLVFSEAHAVGPAIGLAMDSLGTAIAEVAAMAERRIDRLVNPLVSGLPAFLAAEGGAASGFMIAQYSAVSLVNENRRLAAPASLDGGVTSALQEDHLAHATPAAFKALKIIANAEHILAIELIAAAQAYDLQPGAPARAAGTDAVYRALRAVVLPYADDRPLAGDMELARGLIRASSPRRR